MPRRYLLLILIVALGAALRLYDLGTQDLWFDELQSMESSAGRGWIDDSMPRDTVLEKPQRAGSLKSAAPWWKIPSAMTRQEVLPPLYFILLRFWRIAFGDGEAAIRALSTIASIAAIVLIYFVARQLFDVPAALWAAALMALAPTQIEFAQEARTYALTAALLLGAALAILRLERKPTFGAAIALFTCLLCAMLTHYFAAGAAIGLGLYCFFLPARPRRFALVSGVAAAIVYVAAWGPSIFAQRANFHRDLGVVVNLTTWGSPLTRIAAAIAAQVSEPLPTAGPLIALLVLTLLATISLQSRVRTSLLALLWFICGLGLLAAIDIVGGSSTLTLPRYGTLFAPAMFLLLSGAVAGRKPVWRHIFPAIFAAACIFHLHDAYIPWKGHWLDTAQLILRNSHEENVVVIATHPQRNWWLGRSCIGLTWYAADAGDHFPMDVIMLTRPPQGDVLARLRQSKSFWIVTNSTQDEPDFAVPGIHVDSRAYIPQVFMLFRVHWDDSSKTDASPLNLRQ